MRRFFAQVAPEGKTMIQGAEARHISRVLRMQTGDMLVLFDGSGYDYRARIEEIGVDSAALKVLDKKRSDSEPEVRIKVYQAVIKNDRFDYALQKCTEVGADSFVPYLSERCVKRPKSAENFLERSRRIVREASKQCGRSKIPGICELIEFSDMIAQIKNEYTIFAYENEKGHTLKQLLQEMDEKEISIVVGPEGGFAEKEARELVEAGAHSVSLGKLILRAETAGVAAIAMVLYEFGE